MDGKYIYDTVNSQLNVKDRRVYLSTLTQEQKLLYTRYSNKVRQDKFKAKEANKTKYNEIRKEHIKELRQTNPEKMKEQNVKDVRNFRKKEKAINVLTNAIKARNARKEMNQLKVLKAQKAIIPKKLTKEERRQRTLEKKREYMRKYIEQQALKKK